MGKHVREDLATLLNPYYRPARESLVGQLLD